MEKDLPKICPKCDALMKSEICLRCGFVEGDKKDSGKNEVSSSKDKADNNRSNENNSIFVKLNKSDGLDVRLKVQEHVSKLAKSVPVLLGLILAFLFGLTYYRFIYFSPEFVSPLVLSAQEIKQVKKDSIDENGINTIPLTQLSSFEKVIDLDLGLEEGNFEQDNFALFASQDTQILVHGFDIKKTYDKFFDDDNLKFVQDELDISDDDLAVYFSKGYAVIFPQDDLDNWGFVIGVEDTEYVEEKMKEFRELADVGGEVDFSKFFVDVVKLNESTLRNLDSLDILTGETEEEGAVVEETASIDDTGEGEVAGDSDVADEESDSEKEVTEEEKPKFDAEAELEKLIKGEDESDQKSYLLVSNSNEYLDRMREHSEGILPSLSESALYVDGKVDSVTIGNVRIYKAGDQSTWEWFTGLVSSKYDYVGFDKILNEIQESGILLYTKDGKLKIITSGDE